MSEWSNKTKVIIFVILLLILAPLLGLSEAVMDPYIDGLFKAPEKSGNPEMLYRIARMYQISQRPEKAEPIYKLWLQHYGGTWDDIAIGECSGYMPWLPWDEEEHKLPKAVTTKPHKLTPFVLMQFADHLEKMRHYTESHHLWMLIIEYWKDCPEAQAAATKALFREKQRQF